MAPRLINILLGLWLMAAPSAIGYGDAAAANEHIVGPLVASIACIAVWEVMRSLRWATLLLGIWLAVSPVVLSRPLAAQFNCAVAGVVIAACACLGGRVRQQFGGGWISLWRETRP